MNQPVDRRERQALPSVILRGNTSGGSRTVFARATKLTQDEATGRSTFDPELLALAARQARREEPIEVAIVTADAHHSLLLPLPTGLILAAVIAEWETDPRFVLPRDLTIVAGVGGARDAIAEGEWVIVDPVRQRVTVAPDPGAIARLQHQLRPRYRLGDQEQPARTLSGLEVLVWARISTQEELAGAIAAGADGFVVDGPGDFLPWETESDAVGAAFARLFPVAEAAGGGDVALFTSLDAVDVASIVRLAAQCRLRLLLAPESLPLSLPELRAEFSAIVDEEMDAGRLAAMPRIAALLSALPAQEGDCEEYRDFIEATLLPFSNEEIATLNFPLLVQLPPLFVFVAGEDAEEITATAADAVAAGVRGVIVAPDKVRELKAAILFME